MQVLAAQGPVLALFDDIHWAEPAFLDLLENLLETIDDAPVLLLATARHDLLEERPQWGERERSSGWCCIRLATSPRLRSLQTCWVRPVCPSVVRRIVDAAEGNPLYVEQMLAMLIDTGAVRQEGGQWVSVRAQAEIAVPPTIQALLEARLGQLAAR